MSAFPKNYNFTDLENLVENHPNWEWDMHWLSFNPSEDLRSKRLNSSKGILQAFPQGRMVGVGNRGICSICLKIHL